MKRMIAVGLLSIGALVGSMPAEQASAGTRIEDRDTLRADLAALRSSLKPAQRAALVKASAGWRALADDPGAFMRQVEQDVTRILPAEQARFFLGLAEPGLAGGGNYWPVSCFSVSKVAVVFGVVGYIGCPGSVSGAAAYNAYKASAYATTCMFEGGETCDGAVTAAAASVVGWEQLVSTCDVADTALYSSGATYALCGGTW